MLVLEVKPLINIYKVLEKHITFIFTYKIQNIIKKQNTMPLKSKLEKHMVYNTL